MRKARLLLIPVLAGLVASIVAYAALPSQSAPAQTLDLVPVVVAKEPIPARTPLTAALFAVRQVPRELTAGAVTSLDEVEGRINTQPLAAGEIVLQERLAGAEQGALAYRIPEGKRAVTVRVDEIIGVAGHALPGDRVDVVSAVPAVGGTDDPAAPRMEVQLLLQDVLILARGPSRPAGEGAGEEAGALGGTGGGAQLTSYTLAVTPQQAVELMMMEQIGAIKLILRPAVAEPPTGNLRIDDRPYRP